LRWDEPTFENIAGATSDNNKPRITITISNSISVKPARLAAGGGIAQQQTSFSHGETLRQKATAEYAA
jgi:hypothetical protein